LLAHTFLSFIFFLDLGFFFSSSFILSDVWLRSQEGVDGIEIGSPISIGTSSSPENNLFRKMVMPPDLAIGTS